MPRQAQRLVDLRIGNWRARDALIEADGADQTGGRGIGWIDRERLVEQQDGSAAALEVWLAGLGQRAQIQIVRIEATGWLARRPLDLREAQLWLDRARDARFHLVLPFQD